MVSCVLEIYCFNNVHSFFLVTEICNNYLRMVQNFESPLQKIPQYLEGIAFQESTGQLALAASNIIGRDWDGTVSVFDDPKFAPNLPHLDFGMKLESGAIAVEWINNQRVIVSTDAGCLEVIEMKERPNMENVLRLIEHGDMCGTISLNKETNQLLSGGYDTMIKLWDLEVDVSINTFQFHTNVVHKLKWSGFETQMFCSVSEDQSVILYDNRKNEKPGMIIDKINVHFPTAVEWLSSEKVIVGLSNGDLIVYDLRNLSEKSKEINSHSKYVTDIANVSGTVFSASEDCTVKGLDANSFDVKYNDKRHTDHIKCLAFNAKDGNVWSSGWDGKLFSHPSNTKMES